MPTNQDYVPIERKLREARPVVTVVLPIALIVLAIAAVSLHTRESPTAASAQTAPAPELAARRNDETSAPGDGKRQHFTEQRRDDEPVHRADIGEGHAAPREGERAKDMDGRRGKN